MFVKSVLGLFLISSIIQASEWSYTARSEDGDVYEIKKIPNSHFYQIESEGLVESTVTVKGSNDLPFLFKELENVGIDVDKNIKAEFSKQVNKSFKAARPSDLIDAGLSLSQKALKVVSPPINEDCDKDKKNQANSAPKKTVEKEFICECELPKGFKIKTDEKDHNISFLGKVVSEEYDFGTGNDNLLHGGYTLLTGEQLGDDRGRTFSMKMSYKLVGVDGEFRMGLESVGFGRLHETSPGSDRYFVTKTGEYFQDFLERDRLDLSLRKSLYKQASDYMILGAELEHKTDSGFLAQMLQEKWHDAWKEQDVIQYKNVDHMDDETHLKAYGGIGKEWLADLGNWKCRATGEATIKASTEGLSKTEVKIRGDAQVNSGTTFGRSQDNPWLAVALWAEGNVNLEGDTEKGAGVEISTSAQVSSWNVKPYIGANYYNEEEDRLFNLKKNNINDLEHVIGIRVTKKFR